MKRLLGIRNYVVLAAIGAVAILVAQAWAQDAAKPKPTRPPVPPASKATHVLILGDYVATKGDQAHFESVLDGLSSAASMDLYSQDKDGTCKHHTGPHGHKVCLRTDRTITPESASNDDGKVTFIQTRTTIQVASTSWTDIKKVVDELQ